MILLSHLRDGWERPEDAGEEDVFLMISCMETWFLADRESLRLFFGADWKDNAIPRWPDLEKVEKTRVFEALVEATKQCGKKRYRKGRISFDLISAIEPARVRERCASADKLLNRLSELWG